MPSLAPFISNVDREVIMATSVLGQNSVPAQTERLRTLHPGWFASVMGTSILAVATYDNPGNQSALLPIAHAIGRALAIIAYVVAAVLFVAYLTRWIKHGDAAMSDLRHPVLGATYGTFPGGLLVLAVMTSLIGPSWFSTSAVIWMISVLAIVGGGLAVAVSLAFGYILFTGEPSIAMVNGGWFIPPVVTIILPMVLVPLMPHVSPPNARLLLMLGYAFYGMGLLLFALIMSMLYDRLVLHPLPHVAMSPSLWIGLGPVGVGVLALLSLAHAGAPIFKSATAIVVQISLIGATAIWGFGLWWLATSIALLVRYVRAGKLPYSIGWWAFTFPLGAYTVATLTLARAWNITIIEWFAGLLYMGLVVFWVLVAVATIKALRNGQAWMR